MQFPSHSLIASGGELYSHIHENELTGLKRGLFWNVTAEFSPITYAESEFECSMTCEWIPWAIRDWRALDGQTLEVQYNNDGSVKKGVPNIEASFYVTSHDPARSVTLKLTNDGSPTFGIDMKMVVAFHGYAGGDANPNMPVTALTQGRYFGLIIVKGNLSPKPNSERAVLKVADQFVDLDTYQSPVDENWRWVFRPKAFRKKK